MLAHAVKIVVLVLTSVGLLLNKGSIAAILWVIAGDPTELLLLTISGGLLGIYGLLLLLLLEPSGSGAIGS